MPARVAGDPDDAAESENLARRDIIHVVLPDMHAIAAGRESEVGPVVENERNDRGFCAMGRSASQARRMVSSSQSFKRN